MEHSIEIGFTQGGRSAPETWSAEFLCWTGYTFDKASWRPQINQLIAEMQPMFRPDIKIENVLVRPRPDRGIPKGITGNFLSFSFNAPGTRVLQAGYVPAPLDVCALFNKDADTAGYGGQNFFRGCYIEGEYTTGADGFIVAKLPEDTDRFDDFVTYMQGQNAGNFRFVLPAAPKDSWANNSRNIDTWVYKGPTRRDLRNNRRSPEVKQKDADNAAIGGLIEAVQQAVKVGTFFTGGGGIDPALAIKIAQFVAKYGLTAVIAIASRRLPAPIVTAIRALGPGTP